MSLYEDKVTHENTFLIFGLIQSWELWQHIEHPKLKIVYYLYSLVKYMGSHDLKVSEVRGQWCQNLLTFLKFSYICQITLNITFFTLYNVSDLNFKLPDQFDLMVMLQSRFQILKVCHSFISFQVIFFYHLIFCNFMRLKSKLNKNILNRMWFLFKSFQITISNIFLFAPWNWLVNFLF